MESSPSTQPAHVAGTKRRVFNKKQIDANCDAVRREFRAYAEERPAVARVGSKVGAAFMEVLLQAQNDEVPPQQMHQAIQFVCGWMLATSIGGEGVAGGKLRKTLLELALTETRVFAETMLGNGNVPLPESGEETE